MFVRNFADNLTVLSLFFLLTAIVYYLVTKNFLKNIFYTEKIIATNGALVMSIKKWGCAEEKWEFNLDEITSFGHAGSIKYTDHPMNNAVIDFTGLAVGERQLQVLVDDGTIVIETANDSLRFGKNMPSWDTEEIVARVEGFTGRKFVNKYANDPSVS